MDTNYMEITILLSSKILSMFLSCIVGFIVVKVKLLTSESSEVLSKLLLYVGSPCAIILAYRIELTTQNATGLLIALGLSILVHILFIAVCKLCGGVLHFSGLEKASIIYSNAGFLIIPIVQATLGNEYVFYTCAYCGLQTVLYWTHCRSLITETNKIEIKKILLNPCIIAIAIGLVVYITGIKFPSIIESAMTDFSLLLGPLCMFVVGMLIANINLKEMFTHKKTYLVCAFRLLVLPLLVIVMFKFLALFFYHEELDTIMLIVLWSSSSSIGSVVVQMSQIFEKDYRYASRLNLISVLFCIVTMPIITYIF